VSTRVRDIQSQSDVSDDEANSESMEQKGFPIVELFQCLMAFVAILCLSFTVMGVLNQWSTNTIAVFFSAALFELFLALATGVYISFQKNRSRSLYRLGMILTVISLAISSAIFVFLSEV
jgi:hypothetical protein